jgi:hypothetical protein
VEVVVLIVKVTLAATELVIVFAAPLPSLANPPIVWSNPFRSSVPLVPLLPPRLSARAVGRPLAIPMDTTPSRTSVLPA